MAKVMVCGLRGCGVGWVAWWCWDCGVVWGVMCWDYHMVVNGRDWLKSNLYARRTFTWSIW